MARVTVEDCAEVVPNRFELVALASQRAKSISSGTPITVERDNDKDPVIALREIAQGSIDAEQLRESLVLNSQEKVRLDEYGVETDAEVKAEEATAEEIIEDIAESQGDASEADADALLYGDDNLDVED